MRSMDRFTVALVLGMSAFVSAAIIYGNRVRGEASAACRARGGEPQTIYRQGVVCYAPGVLR